MMVLWVTSWSFSQDTITPKGSKSRQKPDFFEKSRVFEPTSLAKSGEAAQIGSPHITVKIDMA
jgi:hypothetical protein